MGTKVRILAVLTLDGITYKPNQVVDMPPAPAKALAANNQVDPHKEAVAYCVKELGAEVIVHVAPPSSADLAERMAAIADCEARLAAAPDADKPSIEVELAALNGE